MDLRKNCAFDKLFTVNVPHILENIFFSLDFKSYMKCLEVRKSWNELLKSESYKRKAKCMFHQEITEEVWHAVKNDNAEAVRRLLSSGMVDVNLQKSTDWGLLTLLGYAASKDHKEVAKLLLDAGADIDKAMNGGSTRLCCYAATGHPHNGTTPLHRAVTADGTDVIKLLLSRGADFNKADDRGFTPLHWAAYFGRTDVAELLLNRGADFNKANNYGSTPLHKAAAYGRSDVLKLLLQAGADSTVTDNNGNTPLYIAVVLGYKKIINILSNVV